MSWEVPTMQSKTSCCKGGRTLFRKALTRWWPLWAGYAFVLFLMLPMPLLNHLERLARADAGSWLQPVQNIAFAQIRLGLPLVSIFAGLFMAGAVFDFLFSARSTNMMASLPVKREGVFLSHFAAGAVMLLSADAAIFLLAVAIEAAGGVLHLQSLLTWLAVLAMENLIFYGVAVFCAQLTGHIVILPCLYLLFNFLAPVLQALIESILRLFVYGMHTVSAAWTEWLSPPMALLAGVRAIYEETIDSYDAITSTITGIEGWLPIGVWCAAAMALTALALLLYRRRRMECAGDTVAIPALRPVLKYLTALCCGLGLPVMLYYMLFSGGGHTNLPVFLALTALGTAVGYYGAEMIIRKSFRVFRGRWKGMLAAALVCCAFVCAAAFDLAGFERRVPDPADVESVQFSCQGDAVTLREPENLGALTALHRSIVSHQAENEAADDTRAVLFEYRLKNGGTLERYYAVAYDMAADSDLREAERLFNVAEARNLQQLLKDEVPVALQNIVSASVDYTDEDGSWQTRPLSATEAMDLYENAIAPDWADGRLGHRWLIEDDVYYNAMYDATIYLELRDHNTSGPEGERRSTLTFRVQTGAERTLAWLGARGVTLVTMAGIDSSYKPIGEPVTAGAYTHASIF